MTFRPSFRPPARLLHRTPCGRMALFNRMDINLPWNSVHAIYAFIKGPRWYREPLVYRWIYIGETDDLKRRMCDHLGDSELGSFLPDAVLISTGHSEADRKIIEKDMIQRYRPMKNIQHNFAGRTALGAGSFTRPVMANLNPHGLR